MKTRDALIAELDLESPFTRRTLERVPLEKGEEFFHQPLWIVPRTFILNHARFTIASLQPGVT